MNDDVFCQFAAARAWRNVLPQLRDRPRRNRMVPLRTVLLVHLRAVRGHHPAEHVRVRDLGVYAMTGSVENAPEVDEAGGRYHSPMTTVLIRLAPSLGELREWLERSGTAHSYDDIPGIHDHDCRACRVLAVLREVAP
jgi:hypothetical protein